MTDYEQANKLLQDAQRIRYRQGAYSWVHICPTILNQMAIDKYTQAGRMYQKCNKMENASFAYLEAAEIAQSCPRNLHKAFQNMFLATFCFMEVVGNIEHVDLICFNKCVLMSIEAGDIEGSAVLADKIVDKLKSLKKGKSSQIINFYKGVIEAYEIHNGEYSTESYIDKYKLELFEYLLMWGDHGQAFDLFDEVNLIFITDRDCYN
ncbi:hypothetical protein RF11_00900 [Thelohanellus kitauei]|uniref:Uncharacterized protein n=1 Tax=Thelohanellus kitauei TaxID=669202 RepID=A0A0C2IJI0_THEKT|nr:hypothetical protein RF11_00900 [Thelohanellus kitauei]